MKKIIALIISLVFMFVMTACGNEEAGSGNGGNGGAQNGGQSNSENGGSQNNGGNGGESQKDPNTFEGVVFGEYGSDHNFKFTKKDGNKATLVLEKIALQISKEDAAQGGINGAVDVIEVYTYDVTYTEKNGTYTAKGGLKSLAAKFNGSGAEGFKKMALESIESDSKYDKAIKNLYEGKTLTNIEEIEYCTYQINETFNITFNLKDGEMAVNGFSVEYTQFGSQEKMKEVYTVILASANNLRISKVESFNNNVIEEKVEFNEAGKNPSDVWKTVTRYEDGKVSSVEKYDFNGKEINSGTLSDKVVVSHPDGK